MKRILLSGGCLFAIVGGCSSTSNYGFADAGPDGATTSIIADAGPATDAKKKSDAKTLPDADAVEEDAGVTKKDATTITPGSCTPGSVTSFTPTWHPPVRLAGACTASQIQTVLDCTLDPNANAATCQTVLANTANKACIACAITDSNAASYGPLISGNGIVGLNMAGCVALKTSNVTSTGCGAKYQALGECSQSACEPNCPVTDDASFAEYQKCATAAEAAGCASFSTGAACIDPLVATGGAAAACDISTKAFIDSAKAFTTIFCL